MPLKIKIILSCLLVGLQLMAYENFTTGAKSASMGHASVMIADVWSVDHNQGAMAFYNKLALGVHHENRFLIPEHAFQAALLTIPLKPGVIGFTYSYFGYRLYNDKKLGIAFSKKLIERLALGIQMDLINSYQSEYGKENRICAEIGILAEPLDNLFIGAHVFNPLQNNYKYFDLYEIPTVFKLGAGYCFEEKLMFTFETEKDIDDNPVFKGGIDYNALYGLHVRIGIASNPAQYAFGLGYIYKHIFADIAFMSHPELGFTPHFSFCYEFN